MKLDSISEKNRLSVVVPAYNEEQSLPILVGRLIQTLEENNIRGEIVIVDDGSTDETGKIVDELGGKYGHVRALHHKRRMGKTTALLTGFENASGDVLAIIDADLQYAPEDLPGFLERLEQGYDVINGWRKHRKDSIFRRIPSSLYNLFSQITFRLALHDHNSGFKVFKREVLREINLRTGQHRFILNLAHFKGYRVGEVEVQHSPRKYGKTKYGSSRIILGLLDLVSLKLQLTFMERPMALFGMSGLALLLLGLIFAIVFAIYRFVYGHPAIQHLALLMLATVLIIAGIQSFLFGFIADMIAELRAEREKYD